MTVTKKVITMSSNVLGRKIAKTALSYEGVSKGSKRHKEIIDTFNKVKPYGVTATYTDNYCAEFASAIMIKNGMTQEDVPLGVNVPKLVEDAKTLGIWRSKAHIPRAGDEIVYDWNKDKDGDHVGIVYKVDKTYIYIFEGNTTKRDEKGRTIATSVCTTRKISKNYDKILGFICPSYNAILMDRVAKKASYPASDKEKAKKRPNAYFRAEWKKHFPKKKYNNGCHVFVMLCMKVCGYRLMPLIWTGIRAYFTDNDRAAELKFKGKPSELRKGDIMMYRRVDSKGKKHYHIWIIVEVNGKLVMAEARQKHYYAYQTKTLDKALKTYDKMWLFRLKEAK